MSVYMTLRVKGDPDALERLAAENPDGPRAIADAARSHGVISHRFFGSDSGEIMVFDEWESEEGFHAFFDSHPEIATMMAQVGVTEQPQITFWRKLDTRDEI